MVPWTEYHTGIPRSPHPCLPRHGWCMGYHHVLCRMPLERHRYITELALPLLRHAIYVCRGAYRNERALAQANSPSGHVWCAGRAVYRSDLLVGCSESVLWFTDYRDHRCVARSSLSMHDIDLILMHSYSGNIYPNLAGNMGSCCSGALISIIITLIKPDNDFDWSETKKINPRGRAMDQQLKHGLGPAKDGLLVPSDTPSSDAGTMEDLEKAKSEVQSAARSVDDEREDSASNSSEEQRPEDYATLQRSLRAATWASAIMSFIIVFVRTPCFLSLDVNSSRSNSRAYTAHTDPDVSLTLRVFLDILQSLDDHLCHLAIHRGVHYVGSSAL